MGRKKKYLTAEERREAQNRWAREYYERNKEKINEKLMKVYYGKKHSKSSHLQDDKLT